MSIEPLSRENIKEATTLAHEVFPSSVGDKDDPDISYKASLEPERYRSFLERWDLKTLEYWVVREDGALVAGTGLYGRNGEPDVAWLGWYFVAPAARGKGIGRELLEWSIAEARRRGFKRMKLYTSTDPNEAAAQVLYEKLGFKLVGEDEADENGIKVLYREREL